MNLSGADLTIDEARTAFAAATSTRYWRTFDWYVDKILDQALAAGLDASDHKADQPCMSSTATHPVAT